MANAMNDRNALWKLLVEAFKVQVLTLERGSDPRFAGFADRSPNMMPVELEQSEKIYSFRVSGVANRVFKICFNPALRTDKETEYFSRGCTLIRELLNIIFEKYNVLFVKNVKYDDRPDVDFSRYTNETYRLETAEDDVSSQNVVGKFRYRVGFWVTVKDQIDKRVSNEVFSFDMPVEFADGAIQYRSDMDFHVGESGGAEDPVYYEIENIPDGAKEAVAALSECLQREEEKEKIFRIFLQQDNGGLKSYIKRREQQAQNMVDGSDPVFRYNVLPLTIYLDRMQYKRYTYSLTHKSGESATFPLLFDPTREIGSVGCPCCGARIEPNGKDKLVLAYKHGEKNRTPVVACTKCTVDLGETGYYEENKLNVYVKKDVINEVDHNGTKIPLYKGDAFRNELDGRFYSIKSGKPVQNYYLRGELRTSAAGKLFPAAQVHTCVNCDRAYAVTDAELSDFEQNCIVRPVDSSSMTACVNCVDVYPNAARNRFNPKWSIYRSEKKTQEGADLFFRWASSGRICASCGKALYYEQTQRCSICGEDCCNDKGCFSGGMCKNCRNAIGGKTRVEADKATEKKVWKCVMSMIPLSERRKVVSRTIFVRETESRLLYYVVLSRNDGSAHIYCFEKQRGLYILLNRDKTSGEV